MSIIFFTLGLIVGCVVTVVIFLRNPAGTIIADIKDSDEDPYFIVELHMPPKIISKKRFVVMLVSSK